ncbi:hypothetical protein DFH06DRAFT_1378365 [Mycena polygramma]|nr:hypothetical protein DFH06DRAFT_1378365 [Mycena polygramma]
MQRFALHARPSGGDSRRTAQQSRICGRGHGFQEKRNAQPRSQACYARRSPAPIHSLHDDTPLPTSNGYPPPQSHTILSRLTPAAPPTRIRRLLAFIAVLSLSSTLLVYLVFSPAVSLSGFTSGSMATSSSDYHDDYVESGGDGPSSPFFPDTHPALHARLFLARAQAEIRVRRLDTCDGQLGARMVDPYIDNAVPYCSSKGKDSPTAITCFPAGRAAPKDTPNAWWPYPQALCASNQLTHAAGWGGNVPARGTFEGQCTVSEDGERLKAVMGREVFLGKERSLLRVRVLFPLYLKGGMLMREKGGDGACGEVITHPVLFIHRQDRWNPFHVGEDLVTTFLALTLFSRQPSSSLYSATTERTLWRSLSTTFASANDKAFKNEVKALAGQLAHTQDLQLVFQDEHLPMVSLFAPLYDRMGAFPPRRTAAEGLGEGGRTCFAPAFHSVGAGAGASLLSATGVGREHRCASELAWGASLWLRWVWGFEGVSEGAGVSSSFAERGLHRRGDDLQRGKEERRDGREKRAPIAGGRRSTEEPIQVLFLSRETYAAYTRHTNHKLTPWQETRHIQNEAELRAGLAGLCRVVTEVVGGPAPITQSHTPGSYECAYADALPGAWGVRMHRGRRGRWASSTRRWRYAPAFSIFLPPFFLLCLLSPDSHPPIHTHGATASRRREECAQEVPHPVLASRTGALRALGHTHSMRVLTRAPAPLVPPCAHRELHRAPWALVLLADPAPHSLHARESATPRVLARVNPLARQLRSSSQHSCAAAALYSSVQI